MIKASFWYVRGFFRLRDIISEHAFDEEFLHTADENEAFMTKNKNNNNNIDASPYMDLLGTFKKEKDRLVKVMVKVEKKLDEMEEH